MVYDYVVHFDLPASLVCYIYYSYGGRVSYQFMRSLAYSIKQSVFWVSTDATSFQIVVSVAKEAEHMQRKEFGDPKRVRTSGKFSGTHQGVGICRRVDSLQH